MKFTIVCFPLIAQTVYAFTEYDAVSQYKQMLKIDKSTDLNPIVKPYRN
jgi:hypothetical protein